MLSTLVLDSQLNKKMEFVSLLDLCFGNGALLVTATLAIISFNRCLSIVKPFIHMQTVYETTYSAVIIIVIAWIVCAALTPELPFLL